MCRFGLTWQGFRWTGRCEVFIATVASPRLPWLVQIFSCRVKKAKLRKKEKLRENVVIFT